MAADSHATDGVAHRVYYSGDHLMLNHGDALKVAPRLPPHPQCCQLVVGWHVEGGCVQ